MIKHVRVFAISRIYLSLFLLIVLSGASTVATSQEEPRRQGIFSESIDVTIVNLEVIAIDEKGRSVEDLRREELQVFEDGQPVELLNFYSVQGGVRVQLPGEELAEPSPLGWDTPQDDDASYALILIDDDHLSPANRNRLLDSLRDRVDDLVQAGAWIMVAVKSRSLEIEQRLTTDPVLVLAAIDRVEKRAGGGAMAAAQLTMLRRQIERGAPPSGDTGGGLGSSVDVAEQDAQDLLGAIELYSQELYQQVRQSTGVLDRFVGSLAGLPGRKALLYVSDGLPARPGELLFRIWFAKYGRAYGAQLGVFSAEDRIQEYDTSMDVLDLIASAGANRVIFYPVDASRDPSSSAISAASNDMVSAAVILQTASQDGGLLGLLARETGGVALIHNVDVGVLVETMQQDLSTYYSLGFESPHQGDGKDHEIEVKVLRKGVRLRYLNRYRSKSPDQQMVDRTLTALLLDVADNPLEVRLEVEQESRQKDGTFIVPLVVRIPISKLALIPESTAHVGSLSIYIAVRDDKGRSTPNLKISLPVSLPNEKLVASMSQYVGYRAKLQMRQGDQKIAIGVLDDLGQKFSTLNLKVKVGGS